MSRLFTSGFELVNAAGTTAPTVMAGEDAAITDGGSFMTGVTLTRDTSVVRSGASALKIAVSNTNNAGLAINYPFTGVVTRTYWARIALNWTTHAGTANYWPLSISDGTNGVEVLATSAGVLALSKASVDGAIGSTFTASTGQWYVIELSWTPNTGAAAFYVNGSQISSGTVDTTSSTSLVLATSCWGTGTSSLTVNLDDWALNDDQGSANTGRCGLGNVVLLTPASDNATTGFTEGAGGTGSLFAATDNTPPIGKALASATNTSQIKDATSNTTDNYKPNLQTYTAAGVPAGATIVCAQGICNHGNSSTTSRTNGIQVVSNPTIAESTGTTGTTAAGTWPTGWKCLKTANADAPSVTLGTAPVMEFRKGTASTDSSMADLIGLYVEYTPAVSSSPVRSPVVVSQAVNRASTF